VAIALVSASKNIAGAASSSVNIAPAATTTAGNCLILGVWASGTHADVGITDPLGSWVALVTNSSASPADHTIGFYGLPNATSHTVSDTIAVSCSGAGEIDVQLLEYSGVATSSILDNGSTGNYGGVPSTLGDPGSITTAVADDLVLGFSAQPSTTSVTAGSGFTLQLHNGAPIGYEVDTEDQIVTGTGTFDPTFTYGINAAWFCIGAAIKPAGAAPTGFGPLIGGGRNYPVIA